MNIRWAHVGEDFKGYKRNDVVRVVYDTARDQWVCPFYSTCKFASNDGAQTRSHLWRFNHAQHLQQIQQNGNCHMPDQLKSVHQQEEKWPTLPPSSTVQVTPRKVPRWRAVNAVTANRSGMSPAPRPGASSPALKPTGGKVTNRPLTKSGVPKRVRFLDSSCPLPAKPVGKVQAVSIQSLLDPPSKRTNGPTPTPAAKKYNNQAVGPTSDNDAVRGLTQEVKALRVGSSPPRQPIEENNQTTTPVTTPGYDSPLTRMTSGEQAPSQPAMTYQTLQSHVMAEPRPDPAPEKVERYFTSVESVFEVGGKKWSETIRALSERLFIKAHSLEIAAEDDIGGLTQSRFDETVDLFAEMMCVLCSPNLPVGLPDRAKETVESILVKANTHYTSDRKIYELSPSRVTFEPNFVYFVEDNECECDDLFQFTNEISQRMRFEEGVWDNQFMQLWRLFMLMVCENCNRTSSKALYKVLGLASSRVFKEWRDDKYITRAVSSFVYCVRLMVSLLPQLSPAFAFQTAGYYTHLWNDDGFLLPAIEFFNDKNEMVGGLMSLTVSKLQEQIEYSNTVDLSQEFQSPGDGSVFIQSHEPERVYTLHSTEVKSEPVGDENVQMENGSKEDKSESREANKQQPVKANENGVSLDSEHEVEGVHTNGHGFENGRLTKNVDTVLKNRNNNDSLGPPIEIVDNFGKFYDSKNGNFEGQLGEVVERWVKVVALKQSQGPAAPVPATLTNKPVYSQNGQPKSQEAVQAHNQTEVQGTTSLDGQPTNEDWETDADADEELSDLSDIDESELSQRLESTIGLLTQDQQLQHGIGGGGIGDEDVTMRHESDHNWEDRPEERQPDIIKQITKETDIHFVESIDGKNLRKNYILNGESQRQLREPSPVDESMDDVGPSEMIRPMPIHATATKRKISWCGQPLPSDLRRLTGRSLSLRVCNTPPRSPFKRHKASHDLVLSSSSHALPSVQSSKQEPTPTTDTSQQPTKRCSLSSLVFTPFAKTLVSFAHWVGMLMDSASLGVCESLMADCQNLSIRQLIQLVSQQRALQTEETLCQKAVMAVVGTNSASEGKVARLLFGKATRYRSLEEYAHAMETITNALAVLVQMNIPHDVAHVRHEALGLADDGLRLTIDGEPLPWVVAELLLRYLLVIDPLRRHCAYKLVGYNGLKPIMQKYLFATLGTVDYTLRHDYNLCGAVTEFATLVRPSPDVLCQLRQQLAAFDRPKPQDTNHTWAVVSVTVAKYAFDTSLLPLRCYK